MSKSFLDYQIKKTLTELKEDDLKFLELSGRKTFWSQGYYGQGITVAVIDTGVNPHEEFDDDRLLKGVNVNRDYGDQYKILGGRYDDNKHGTHCAGSIAGKNVGIAPKAKIYPIKVLDGGGGCDNLTDLIFAIDEAIKAKVDIISMSLSIPPEYFTGSVLPSFKKKIQEAVANDILVVCSAGNTYKEEKERYPATIEEVVSVGAVDINKNKAMFSSTGNYVDVCQVGTNVVSAYYKGGYIALDGTSMSTPIVAGISALIACKYKEQYKERISERKLYEALKMFSKDLGIKGVDKYYGAGFVSLQPLDMILEMNLNQNLVKFNGEQIEANPDSFLIQNGRNYVAIRRLAEFLGLNVYYDNKTQTAILKS